MLDRDVSAGDAERLRSRTLGLMLEDTALELGAMALSPLSKTEYALAAPALCGGYQGDYAPFGDVYLSTLEFVARVRNRTSAVVPQELVTLNAVEDCMERVLAQALSTLDGPVDMLDRAAQLLGGLEPGEVDGTLEAHVDRNRSLRRHPDGRRQARGLLAAADARAPGRGGSPPCCRRRRSSRPGRLPSVPGRICSRGPTWGSSGKERMTVDALARAEVNRFADEDTSERMRGEMMGILGDLLGISPEQMEELRSEDGQRRLHEGMKKFEGEVQDAIDKMMGGQGGPQGGPQGTTDAATADGS